MFSIFIVMILGSYFSKKNYLELNIFRGKRLPLYLNESRLI